ncbi:MAG: energy-coupled thiamine transporter ThiT [Defluviitaleaceae bacterium]|nr:energy-coupled thiamine transporter ThiT [Defluviitaleaceae bacterium]
MSKKAKIITYSAICTALAIILNQFALFSMPLGGSVTPISMFFITLIGYWFGWKHGILAGIAMGLVDLALVGFIFHPLQVLFDYPLGFGALGLSGLLQKHKMGLYLGYILGCLGRFFFVFLSGVFFFYIWAPEGWNIILYSAVYNIAYIGVEMIITLVIIFIPSVKNAINRVGENLQMER